VRVSNSTKKIPFLFIFKISFLLIFSLFLNTALFFTGSSNSFRKVYAQQQTEPTFKLYPLGGQVLNKDQGFVVDVLIDSGGQEVVSLSFLTLKFYK
jgi:flagellar basal body-associated protein FliL